MITELRITLKRQGYDPFIDFLKGYSIVCVIINHCMPTDLMDYSAFFFWGVSAVPIFLIIQVFHAYKQCTVHSAQFAKIWKRVAWPFLLTQIIIFAALTIKNQNFHLNNIVCNLSALIKSGGYGPGAYYPWIYMQFAILLPLISNVFRIQNSKGEARDTILCLTFIVISQVAETTCTILAIPQLAFRLLFIRYTFIFYLGYLLAKRGFRLNIITLCLAIVCLAFSGYINYSETDFSPLIYPFVNSQCHWFSYIYIAFILLFLLKGVYQMIPSNTLLMKYFIMAGKYSYEIFLFQMVYFVIVHDYIANLLNIHIDSYTLNTSLKMAIPVILCTIPVIIAKIIVASKKLIIFAEKKNRLQKT